MHGWRFDLASGRCLTSDGHEHRGRSDRRAQAEATFSANGSSRNFRFLAGGHPRVGVLVEPDRQLLGGHRPAQVVALGEHRSRARPGAP